MSAQPANTERQAISQARICGTTATGRPRTSALAALRNTWKKLRFAAPQFATIAMSFPSGDQAA